MRKILFVLLYILILNSVYSEGINNYELKKVAVFTPGSNEGEIGYKPEMRFGGIQVSPSAFTINEDGYIYICDTINARINAYDSNFSFIESITENYYVSRAYDIKVDHLKNIIAFDLDKGLIKIDDKGKGLFAVSSKNYPSVRDFFYPYGEYTLFYENGVRLIDNEGKVITEEKAIKEKIDKVKQKFELKESNIELLCKDEINQFLYKNKIVKKGNILLTADFEKHRKYFQNIKENVKVKNKGEFRYEIEDKIYINLKQFSGKILIGHDKNDNSYWHCNFKTLNDKRAIIVCSKYGEILDCFYVLRYALSAVAPSGDVYLLNVIGEC